MSLSTREKQCKKGKVESNVDGNYHQKVDFMVLGEASQKKRRKTEPMGFRQADLSKLGN